MIGSGGVSRMMSEWISVKDDMPRAGVVVIVEGGIAYHSPARGCWMTLTAEQYPGKEIQWPVTHWMPLPDPPSD
jgi:hypothetical protein